MDFRTFAFSFIIVLCGADSCPSHTQMITEKYKGSCYEFVSRKENWLEAQQYCAKNGGFLVSVTDAEKAEWLANTLDGFTQWSDEDKVVWIGANCNKSFGTWVWVQPRNSEEEPLKYSRWAKDQPEAKLRDRRCALMSNAADNYAWNSYPCDLVPYVFHFVCQYDSEGFFSNEDNLIGVTVGISIPVVGLIILAVICCWRCKQKRRALRQQLNGNEPADKEEQKISQFPPSTNVDLEECVAPDAYAPISPDYNYNNLNVQNDHGDHKALYKDMSIGGLGDRPVYSRSQSTPARPLLDSFSAPSAPGLSDEESDFENDPITLKDSRSASNVFF